MAPRRAACGITAGTDEVSHDDQKPRPARGFCILGEWNDHLERRAQRAGKSEYWQTGDWCRQRPRSDVAMNTEMRTLDDDPDCAEAKRQRRKNRKYGGNGFDGGLIFPRESPKPTKNYAVP